MHHAILGPGGVGGLMGACLAHTGERVTMVVRASAVATYPEQLHLESTFGTFDERVERAGVVPPADVLWIAVKATQFEDALRSIPRPAPVQAIIPLLNGVDHLARLEELFGAEKIIPAVIGGETERLAPGHIHHPAPFLFLNVSERGRAMLEDVLTRLGRIGFTCKFFADEPTLMWSKLVFLAPLALATSASGASIGQVLANEDTRHQLEDCTREACAVATAEKATVSLEGTLKAMHGLPGAMRSSMQKDVEKGNPPEVDAIAGPILRGGIRHGIRTPATEALAAAVERRAASCLDSRLKAT